MNSVVVVEEANDRFIKSLVRELLDCWGASKFKLTLASFRSDGKGALTVKGGIPKEKREKEQD